MIALTPENNYPGALVSKDKKSFVVYKTNQKSFYAGAFPYRDFLSKVEAEKKEKTLLQILKEIEAKIFSFDGFTLNDIQNIQKQEKETKEKKFLSPRSEKEIKKLYERFRVQKGSYRHRVFVDNDEFSIVEAKPDGKVLLSTQYNFVLYNLQSGIFTPWVSVFENKTKDDVPWDLCV